MFKFEDKMGSMVNIDLGKNYTADEYLALEKNSIEKHEFLNGKLFAMPGNKIIHDRVRRKISRLLEDRLAQYGYEPLSGDIKVMPVFKEQYFYPDVTIARAKEQDEESYLATNPVLIVEVLSESNRTYDIIDKFIHYRKIESLQYYLLIEPQLILITLIEKQPNGEWHTTVYNKLEDEIMLTQLKASFTLAEIY